ncbi:MAG TPA: sugar phosphate isomerase/epimerase, partial [Actinomycetes bacterium]|nr:sugar phosphate isomerase/epimerase [Actinomycetes bacterium]
MSELVQVPDAKVALSTASVYPESTAAAFEL